MLSDQGARPRDHKRFARRAIMALTKERDRPSEAAAAYDTQENDLIRKTRKLSRQARGRYATLKQF